MTIHEKLEIIAQKFTYKPSNYILLQDCDGWTDSFIADLTGENIEIQAKVKKIHDTGKKICKYTLDKSLCPKIENVKPDLLKMERVTDIEPVFRTGMLSFYMCSGNNKLLVNGELLSYFVKKFVSRKGYDIELYLMNNDRRIIAIVYRGTMLGLLMPMTDHD